jgi:hypothetical protein
LSLENRSRNGPRKNIRAHSPEFGEIAYPRQEWPPTGCRSEHGIAVQHSVRRIYGTGETILRHDCEGFGLCLAKNGVGGDERYGCVLTGAAFGAGNEGSCGDFRGKTKATELRLNLHGRRPEMGTVANDDAPASVHCYDRPNGVALGGNGGCRAEAALKVNRRCTVSGSCGAKLEFVTSAAGGGVAKLSIGRKALPVLVTPIEEVEEDRGADQGNPHVADRKATANLAQLCLHACRGIQAERRPARQNDGINVLDRSMRLKQVGFASTWRAASHVNRRNGGLRKNDRSHPGGGARVVGLPDQNAIDISNEILVPQAWLAKIR